MSNIRLFFTPIKYETHTKSASQSLLEKVDDYFYLGGKKALVIKIKNDEEKVILKDATLSKAAKAANVAKIVSYCFVLIPIILLCVKGGLRATHKFKLIDPTQIDFTKKLEKGVDITSDMTSQLEALLPTIRKENDADKIIWLSKGKVFLVFKLAEFPNTVFKMAQSSGEEDINSRFENMVTAKRVCYVNALSQLVIPHAKKFKLSVDGKEYFLIAEQRLSFNPQTSAQERDYRQYSKSMNETARQIAVLIAETGLNDVTWRNFPIANAPDDYLGPRLVALLDLEHMENGLNGFIGDDDNKSRGLIRCLAAEQIELVIAEARRRGVAISRRRCSRVKKQRLDELELDDQLFQLYEENGIVSGKEPIEVDIETLGLTLTEEEEDDGETITLRQVAEEVIEKINESIENSSNQASTKGKRFVELNTNKEPFMLYQNFGLPKKAGVSEEDYKQAWLYRVLQALQDAGKIQKFDRVRGRGYYIQA